MRSPRPEAARRGSSARCVGLVALATLCAPPAAAADTTIEAESMRLRPGVVRPDGEASGGRAVALLRRGSATKTVKVDRSSGSSSSLVETSARAGRSARRR